MPLALVTGGSAGIGAAFADRLAARGHDLILVARGSERLTATARGIAARHRVRVDVLAADLAERHGLFRLEALLGGPDGMPVDVLVNNAGYGCGVAFGEADSASLQAEVDLNITATLRLTHAVLPGMVRRGHGTVVNVGSVAGWLPQAGSSYGPTKAWVAAFTDALAPSLRGTGVTATALCPGFVRTGWHDGPAPGGVTGTLLWADPARVVETCLADVAAGRTISVPGPVYRPLVDALEFPRRTLRMLARVAGISREHRLPVAADARSATPAPRARAATPAARSADVRDRVAADPSRPRLPDLPAHAPQRVVPCRRPVRSPHFVPTTRLTGEAQARAARARAHPPVPGRA